MGGGGAFLPIRHHNGTIILSLLEGVVAHGLVVSVPDPQDRKLLFDVLLQGKDHGERRHEDIPNK